MSKLKKNQLYSEGALHSALEEVKNGMSVYGASKKYSIPRTTLLYKSQGKRPLVGKSGPPTILTPYEEDILVNWIKQMGKAGFPVTKLQLIESVTELSKKLGKNKFFTNGVPGRAWYEGFLARHGDISKRVSQTLPKYRSIVTEKDIRKWFNEIQTFLGEENIINDPKRVFNCDESGFFLTPSGEKVLVEKGTKKINRIVGNDEKENYTVLIAANAEGMMPPPMVVYPYKRRIPKDIAIRYPKKWGIGYTENGWMTSATFYEYIANIFYPWLLENLIEFPIILFLDGHVSHLTLPLSEFCKENNIILISLLAHSTHIMQPMDVAFFAPLKQAWKQAISKWRMNNCGIKLSRSEFAPLLETVLNSPSLNTKKIFENGFKVCGLCPFSENAIDYRSLTTGEVGLIKSQPQECSKKKIYDENCTEEMFLKMFESRLSQQQKESFLDAEKLGFWNGDIKADHLFNYWSAIKQNIKRNAETKNLNSPLILDLDDDCVINKLFQHGENQLEFSFSIDPDPIEQQIILPENIMGAVMTSPEKVIPRAKEHFPDENIPTPFKESLFWPNPDPVKNTGRKIKDKLPSVATGEPWISYYKKKENEKAEQINKKNERKAAKDKKKNTTKSLFADTQNVIKTIINTEIKISSYVIVQYEEEYFPGMVLDIKADEYKVTVMTMSGPNWRWPEKEDAIWYNIKDIVQINVQPEMLNSRGIYAIKEMTNFRTQKT